MSTLRVLDSQSYADQRALFIYSPHKRKRLHFRFRRFREIVKESVRGENSLAVGYAKREETFDETDTFAFIYRENSRKTISSAPLLH